MIIDSIADIESPPLMLRLPGFYPKVNCYVKIEGLNIAGSIKIKSAKYMLSNAELDGRLKPGYSKVLCSTSGSLGIALAILCKARNYPLTCVSDVNLLPVSEQYMQLYGAKVIKVDKADANAGYLNSRFEVIAELLADDERMVYINQYEDPGNIAAHYETTAQEISAELPRIDYLFVGAGTTGTLMGCAKYFRSRSPGTKIVAVDVFGSVTFGAPPNKRRIPGLGTSVKPPIADAAMIDDIVWIKEPDTLAMCHYLLNEYGLFVGGSTGTVMAAIKQYEIDPGSTVVCISPDFGDRYVRTVYDAEWIKENYDAETLDRIGVGHNQMRLKVAE